MQWQNNLTMLLGRGEPHEMSAIYDNCDNEIHQEHCCIRSLLLHPTAIGALNHLGERGLLLLKGTGKFLQHMKLVQLYKRLHEATIKHHF